MILRWLSISAAATLVMVGTAAGEDDLSDFYNDLVTDLAPFLSLFGESMTKQYLSESTTWFDYLIFAMGPIGILTTIISVIRLCGYSWLEAFIGRSQEGTATVEAELCTSTSRDVCELYNYGGIARILGRPKLLELIYIPSSHCHNGGGFEEELQLFRNYLQTKDPNDHTHWKEKENFQLNSWLSISWPWHFSRRKEQNIDGEDLEAGGEEYENDKNSETSNTREYRDTNSCNLAPASLNPPNLSLNIGIIQLSTWVLYAFAAVGLILQGSVVALASIDAWVMDWALDSNNSSANKDAPFLFVIGTTVMCCGLITCAALVGRSTQEIRYEHRKGSGSRLIWLQPHQVIGDQSFDPFAFFETAKKPVQVWTCSTRKTEGSGRLKTSPVKDKKKTRNRTASLGQTDQTSVSSSSFTTSDGTNSTSEGFSRRHSKFSGRGIMTKFELSSLLSVAAVLFGYVMQFTGLRRMKTWVSLMQLGTTLFMSMFGQEEFHNWNDKYVKIRTKVKEIAAAICKIANEFIYDKEGRGDINIKIPNIIQPDNDIFHDCSSEEIEVTLKAPDGVSSISWTMDAARLEAVMGLTLWTLILNDHSRLGEHFASESVEYARITSLDPYSDIEMDLWYSDVAWGSHEALVRFNAREKHGLLDLWYNSSDDEENPIWKAMTKEKTKPTTDQKGGCEPLPKEIIRLWGWTALQDQLTRVEKAKDSQSERISVEVSFIQTKSSLVGICAQELFTSLLIGLKNELLWGPLGNDFDDAKSEVVRPGGYTKFFGHKAGGCVCKC
ncbi:hypothetical protein CSAL01_07560 [Colletotrichum salicis]|uniref:Ankyrin repeat protein n=1 Tax=Colletotrichum salicis TaxID=1209931 RepID=A0A135V0A4_9PEZI|nr:hypothetical protein CSAL01_07560 [Colletotrichum salicis]